jgi:thiol-disulfide isomerase/thioredoxin
MTSGSTALPVLGRLPGFEGAVGWLNSDPLDPADLRGKVVLVDFWTYTCINWLRTRGYVRAWAARYADHGLVVIGVHTPEFPFEGDVDNVRREVADMRVTYPVAIDSDYGVWRAFTNHYWPAVYIADAQGRIRHTHFGEGGYEECERVIQQLLRDAGNAGITDELVSVADEGFEAQADWPNVQSPETYLGYEQGQNFASADDSAFGTPRLHRLPDRLGLNQWALSGSWTIQRGSSRLDDGEGSIAFRFHARDVNVVLSPAQPEASIPFQVRLDGDVPGNAHGLDIDAEGRGTVREPRLYQLIRRTGSITDSTFEITFQSPGVEGWVFTFG